MPKLVVTNRRGEETRIDTPAGLSLMRVLCQAGFDDILALCGGVCSCGTCHVYIDDGAGSRLVPVSADEDALLNSSRHRRESSRLSCQLLVTAEFDGLRLTIAPED